MVREGDSRGWHSDWGGQTLPPFPLHPHASNGPRKGRVNGLALPLLKSHLPTHPTDSWKRKQKTEVTSDIKIIKTEAKS